MLKQKPRRGNGRGAQVGLGQRQVDVVWGGEGKGRKNERGGLPTVSSCHIRRGERGGNVLKRLIKGRGGAALEKERPKEEKGKKSG